MSDPRFTRRDFLKLTGATALALSLDSLGFLGGIAQATEKIFQKWEYKGWENLHRDEWKWDSVTYGTHLVDCYPGNCSWRVYTRDGIVWREEQAGKYPIIDATGPDWNPRGCQKGCSYSNMMYNPDRVKYPMKRVGERGSGKWKRITWDDYRQSIPVFLTIIAMPLTYSIANGISFGIIAWVLIHALSGRAREVSPLMYVMAVLLAARYAYLGG